MFDLKLDLSEFEAAARSMQASIDQIPYALARMLNDAAKAVRSELIEDVWPKHVTVRNPRFLGWALRTKFATKRDLTIEINDERAQGRGHLAMHADGGVKVGRGRIAIPTRRVQRTSKGVALAQRPLNLKRAVIKGGLIFQAEGRGKKGRLRLMYKLQPTAKIKKDVPFRESFAEMMRLEVMQRFPGAMLQAMRTRR